MQGAKAVREREVLKSSICVSLGMYLASLPCRGIVKFAHRTLPLECTYEYLQQCASIIAYSDGTIMRIRTAAAAF